MIRKDSLSSQWPKKNLGEVVDFLDHIRVPVKQKDRKLGLYPYYGANGQQGSIDGYLFDEPLILLAEDGGHFGMSGKTIAYRVDGKCWVNNHAHVLKPKPCVDINYLCRHLESYDVTPFITGTTRGKLTKAATARIPIIFPPLEEQKRIAAILDKADAVRKKRKQTIELTEQFLRSAFLDMFGDPITNPKDWELRKLGSLSVRFSDGPFGSNLKSSHYVNEGVRVIRLQNIGVGEFLDEDEAYVSREHFQSLLKHQCLSGDILIGTLGNPNLRACTLPMHIDEALNKADCIQMRPNLDVVRTEYVEALINQPGTLALASHLLHGQTRTRISMGTLRNLKVPVPPREIQQEFARIVRFIKSKIKVNQNNARSASTYCFDSFIQKGFYGEL